MTTSPTLTTADIIERIAYANPGTPIEYHDGHMFLTHRGVTLRAVLADTKAAA